MPRRLTAPTALLALLLLAACTGGGGDGTPGGAPAEEEKPGTIVVASGRDVTGSNGVRQRLIDAWNRQQRERSRDAGDPDHYQARLVELPGSADEQRSQLLGALQSGSARYDVVNLDVTWVPEFAEAGLVRALPDDLVDADVIDPVARTARWDGKVYAVPFNSDVGLLYYRRDLLRKAGMEPPYVPDDFTWGQLRGYITTLDDNLDDRDLVNGWTTQLDAYEGRTVNAMEAFATAVPGLTLVDEDGRYTGDVEQLRRGVAELDRRVDPAYVSPDAKKRDETGSMSEFTEGVRPFCAPGPPPTPRCTGCSGTGSGWRGCPGGRCSADRTWR